MAAHLAAMMATPETVNDSNWYPDSSATNHCTPNFNNLMSSDAYHGQEQLHMGDGSGVTIQNVGRCIFPFQFNSSKLLPLKHLLHVPPLTKNLTYMVLPGLSIDSIRYYIKNKRVGRD